MRILTPKEFFVKDEEEKIVGAIREAEGKTSGEIRVHLAKSVKKTAFEDAVQVFKKIGMTKTAERNGVLFYLAVKDSQFAVIGDVGIHQKVPEKYWDVIRDILRDHFQKNDFAGGLAKAIGMCGHELARYFPRKADDVNELPDGISRYLPRGVARPARMQIKTDASSFGSPSSPRKFVRGGCLVSTIVSDSKTRIRDHMQACMMIVNLRK